MLLCKIYSTFSCTMYILLNRIMGIFKLTLFFLQSPTTKDFRYTISKHFYSMQFYFDLRCIKTYICDANWTINLSYDSILSADVFREADLLMSITENLFIIKVYLVEALCWEHTVCMSIDFISLHSTLGNSITTDYFVSD